MNVGKSILLAVAALACASCSSISQEKLMENEQSRVQQERKGYFDRESSEQQKKADERAHQEKLRRKS
jgi:hypothetical protein